MAKLRGPSGRYKTEIGDIYRSGGCWQGRYLSLIPANQFVKAHYDGTGESDCIVLLLPPTTVTAVSDVELGRPIELLPCDHFHDSHLWSAALALKDECRNGGLFGSLYVESLSTFLTLHLLRHYSTLALPLATLPGGLPPAKLNAILTRIDASLDNEITLSELAALAELSTFHFLRAFKHSTGLTPHRYVIHQRIARAKALLASNKQSVTEVAMTCGFATPSHFAVVFRRLVGVTPSEFRRSL